MTQFQVDTRLKIGRSCRIIFESGLKTEGISQQFSMSSAIYFPVILSIVAHAHTQLVKVASQCYPNCSFISAIQSNCFSFFHEPIFHRLIDTAALNVCIYDRHRGKVDVAGIQKNNDKITTFLRTTGRVRNLKEKNFPLKSYQEKQMFVEKGIRKKRDTIDF